MTIINPNLVLHYVREAYSISGESLMGRNAAGNSLLRAYLECPLFEQPAFQIDASTLSADIPQLTRKPYRIINEYFEGLTDNDVIYYPSPDISQMAYRRSYCGNTNFPIIGVTHTTSSLIAIDSILSLLTVPITPADCLICPSLAVQKHVHNLFEEGSEYLKWKFKVSEVTLPNTCVIPLGVNTADFNFTDQQKFNVRTRLGINEDEIVVLYLGRLSFHAKSNPSILYTALGQLTALTDKPIVLLECGWHANEHIKGAFDQAFDALTNGQVRKIYLDGRNQTNKLAALCAADIFVSLVDNIQETFGITPIEAMSAGLPVIVSDWNGYKDSVEEGVTGYRIKTMTYPSKAARDSMYQYALGSLSYDRYCGNVSDLTGVDLDELVRRLLLLCNDKTRRLSMGQEGKALVKKKYSWQKILGQYVELAESLLHVDQPDTYPPDLCKWPGRSHPLDQFKHYPTQLIDRNTLIFNRYPNAEQLTIQFEKLMQLQVACYNNCAAVNRRNVSLIGNTLNNGPLRLHEILEMDDSDLGTAVAWGIKHGLFGCLTQHESHGANNHFLPLT